MASNYHPKHLTGDVLSFVCFSNWYEMESFTRPSSCLLYLCDFWADQTDGGTSRGVCVYLAHKIAQLPDSILAFLAATFLTAVCCWLQAWEIKKLKLFLHVFDCTDPKLNKFLISIFLHWNLCVRNWFICCLNMQSSTICENTCRKCKVQILCCLYIFLMGLVALIMENICLRGVLIALWASWRKQFAFGDKCLKIN